MARLEYFTDEIEVEDDLLRGIILMVSKNYAKEAEITTDTITLQECSWILNASTGILNDLLERLLDHKAPLSMIFKWKFKLDGKDLVITQKNTGSHLLINGATFYVGVVPLENDFDTIGLISKNLASIKKNISKLKRNNGGAEYLGVKCLIDGNIVDYLVKVKYILNKCRI